MTISRGSLKYKYVKGANPYLNLIYRKAPPKVDETEDPSGNLMGMLKQMYDDGDDDMKRTIAKAWTESRDKKGDAPML